MTLPEPAWRIKTRPCPFYQHGRCLFADSCNFLHTVYVRPSPGVTIIDPPRKPDLHSCSAPPIVTVDSPRSFCSPPRSPRLSGLLHALRDVIGDDPEGETYEAFEGAPHKSPDLHLPGDENETLVTEERGNFVPSDSSEQEEDVINEAYSTIAVLDDSSPVQPAVASPRNHDPCEADDGYVTDENGIEDNEPTVHSPIPSRNSIDAPPGPWQDSIAPRAAHRRSISMSSGMHGRSSLNRPSHLRLGSLIPPEIDLSKEDSEAVIDSGYAESWHPPSPPTLTPPRTPIRNSACSTLDLLSSPFGSPSVRMRSQVGFLGRLSFHTTTEDDRVSETSLDCPADCESPRHELERSAPKLVQSIIADSIANMDVLQPDLTFSARAYYDELQSDASVSPGISRTVEALDNIAREVKALEVPTCPVINAVNAPNGFQLKTSETDVFGPNPTQINLSTADATTGSKGVVDDTGSDSVETSGNDDEQSGTSTIFTEDKSFVWDESTPHQTVVPERTDDSQVIAPQINEAAMPEYIVDVPCKATTASDFYSEGSASNVHTPGLTADAGDDDNGSSESLNSSTRLAYLASPTPDNNMHESLYEVYSNTFSDLRETKHSSTHKQVESSPASFKSSSSNVSPVNAPSHERAFTPPSDMQKQNTIKRSSFSPVNSRPFSPQNWAENQSTREISSRLRSQSNTSDSSRKVSFGWRHSETTQSRISDPSTGTRTSSKLTWRTTGSFSDHSSSDRKRSDFVSPTNCAASGLKPLRLSSLISSQHSSFKSSHRSSNGSYTSHSGSVNRASITSSVSSVKSPSYNLLLSSARISAIPEHIRYSIISSRESIPSPLSEYSLHLKNFGEPRSAPVSPTASWHSFPSYNSYDPTILERAPSRASEPALYRIDEQDDGYFEERTIRQPSHIIPHSSPAVSRRSSVLVPTVHAIATPKPTLFFAIASDNADEVRKVLESGEAGPNETIGPQSALEFSLTNDQLTHKTEIVKLLLAYGANPSVARSQLLKQKPVDEADAPPTPLAESTAEDAEGAPQSDPNPVVDATILDMVDPATRYYVEKAEAPDTRRTSAMMHRSSFRALTRVRYEIVGQDRALEELFRVLSIHTRHLSATPIVVLLCGPSGHGKSLLARKFGSLLDVPTHTVNMTTLKSTHDLWKSYSMSPYETPTTCTLAEFLINNEGKRCVVVLDEIEKTEDEKALWSLLMPWELGRCSIEAGSRHVDVRNVVWLGTSNIGHDMILKYQDTRPCPEEPTSQQEYAELMGLLRPKVSERLGASVLSRVTTVLPFVPFTREERKVICSEALYSLAGDAVRDLSLQAVDKMINGALASYSPDEGARSLYRAISSQLVDNLLI